MIDIAAWDVATVAGKESKGVGFDRYVAARIIKLVLKCGVNAINRQTGATRTTTATTPRSLSSGAKDGWGRCWRR